MGILQEAFHGLERSHQCEIQDHRSEPYRRRSGSNAAGETAREDGGRLGRYRGLRPPITEKNKQWVDFTTSTVSGLKTVAVTGPGAPKLERVEDLSGKEVWVNFESSMKTDIDALNARLRSQAKAPAIVKAIDPALEPGDVMEMVNVGTYPIALMQNLYAEFWAQVFDGATPRTEIVVADDVELGWGIQKALPS